MRIDLLARRWGGPQGGRDGMAIATSHLGWTLAELGHTVRCYLPDGAAEPWQHPLVSWVHRTPLADPIDWSADLVITTIAAAWRRTVIAATRARATGRLIFWHHHGPIPSGHGCTLARVADGPPAKGWTREIVLPPSSWALAAGGSPVGCRIVVPGAGRAKGGDVALAVARELTSVPWYVLPGRAGRQEIAPWRALSHADVAPPGLPPESWLAQARLVLSPTRAETYGLCLAEAAARGIPVVASSLPGTRYSVGSVATLLPMGSSVATWRDAVLSALDSPAPSLVLPDYQATVIRVLELTGGRDSAPLSVPACLQPVCRTQRAPLATPGRGDHRAGSPTARRERSYLLPESGVVSVLMAVGPVHRWLAEAAQSVLDQELPEGWDVELLIGVDGVPESLAAARSIAPDQRMGIVYLAERAGPYVASNTLLRHATGDLIGRVDADDVLLPGRMAAIIEALREDPTAGAANTRIFNCSEDLCDRKGSTHTPDGVWVWRREALAELGGWQAWPCGADTELLDRGRALGLGETVVRTPLYLRRRHGGALTQHRSTGERSAPREAAWAAIRAWRVLYREGALPARITPPTARHSVEGPLFGAQPITAGLASIPSRREALAQVVVSLLPQVDSLGVYLDGYDDVPACLDHPRISVVRSQDRPGLGDAGKMLWADEAPGYYLSCDDDLAYPPDYAARMVEAVRATGHTAVCGVHGARVAPGATVYHDPARKVLHYRSRLSAPEAVHVIGTGTAAWHAPSLRIRVSDFQSPNMADLWLAARAQREHIPLLAVQRPALWLDDLEYSGPTVRDSCTRAPQGGRMDTREIQDRLVRQLQPWRTYEV